MTLIHAITLWLIFNELFLCCVLSQLYLDTAEDFLVEEAPMTFPKYAFQVLVEHKNGPEHRRETHNYETLAGATAYASIVIRKPTVHTVRVLVI